MTKLKILQTLKDGSFDKPIVSAATSDKVALEAKQELASQRPSVSAEDLGILFQPRYTSDYFREV
jgi:hypothetical protein